MTDVQKTLRRMIDEPINSIHQALSGVEDREVSMRHTAKVGRLQLPVLTKWAPSEPFLFACLKPSIPPSVLVAVSRS